MSQSFADIWRTVRLHAPGVPFALCRNWTQQAYETLCERRPWVWTTAETRLSTLASRAITVNVTQGSTTITSAGLFLAGDAGRQFRVGTYPVYTLNSVESAASATLDLPYAAPSGAAVGQVLSAYQTLPADFGAFMLVTDPIYQRQLSYWHTQEDLARLDPTRLLSGDPQRALVSTALSTAPATSGQSRFEWYPYPSTARQYPAWYRRRPQQLADTDLLLGVLAQRGNVLQTGALAECARWPGTSEHPNPYFNLQLAKSFDDDFDRECAKLELRDDDQAQQSWIALPCHHWPIWGLGGSTSALRSSDATTADYL